ncbi:MAG: biopolymer transporter ExbD [Calditrichaeota bacterium]|nr:MAG: biopolymer transporter ExbD [Calditrichota bacterium]
MQFKKKSKIKLAIPTASMPDIIFMLLIFFMVATVIRQYSGLKVKLPEAAKVQKLKVSKRHISTIWVDKNNNVVMDDIPVKNIKTLRNLAYQKLVADPQLIISIKADKLAKMSIINDVHQELRKANTLRVNYSALPGEF